MSDSRNDSVVEIISGKSFNATLVRVLESIREKGMTVFAQIDHAAGARAIGSAMLPTTVVIYGNPFGGTPLMLAAPQAALDLPLRVLVREGDGGQVVVSFHPIAPLLRQAGVPETLSTRLDAAQHMLVEVLS